jgi:dolichol-phosphate mannosyltransferase
MTSTRAFGAWRLLSARVGQIEKLIEKKTGTEPVIVGMDKYRISSVTSFYDYADRDGSWNTGGPHLFGGRSLMWEYWLPRSAAIGRNFLMIDFEHKRLANPKLSEHFESVGDVFNETLKEDGRVVASFHWRVGYGYLVR